MSFPRVSHDYPSLVLAPMEGITDAPMRAILSERGGFSYCVSEFIRVSQNPLSVKTIKQYVPEAATGCVTPSGTPVQIQLLGGDAERLAESAQSAVMCGAQAIDLNFGCPAPTVNRHDGGATLLKYPERIKNIVRSVRDALPSIVPVSAKLRLGWDDMNQVFLNAQMAQEGGAAWITIHARTRMQGYIPPAHWSFIGQVIKEVDIPVVANGEIWTLDDFKRCRDQTQANSFMVGRGVLGDPELSRGIARELGIPIETQSVWKNVNPGRENYLEAKEDWIRLLRRFCEISGPDSNGTAYTASRLKQWLRYAHQKHQVPWFEQIKKAKTTAEVFSILDA